MTYARAIAYVVVGALIGVIITAASSVIAIQEAERRASVTYDGVTGSGQTIPCPASNGYRCLCPNGAQSTFDGKVFRCVADAQVVPPVSTLRVDHCYVVYGPGKQGVSWESRGGWIVLHITVDGADVGELIRLNPETREMRYPSRAPAGWTGGPK